MSRILFTEHAWEELHLLANAGQAHPSAHQSALRDIQRDPFDGIGKPEPLRGELSGFWSRRIDECNRIVYRVKDDIVELLQCKGHYDD